MKASYLVYLPVYFSLRELLYKWQIQFQLYLSGIMALALCAPPSAREESRTSTNQAQILKQINHVNDDGLYTFGYEAGNSTFKVILKY